MLDAIIISDLHLGSKNCQAEHIKRQLEQIIDGETPTRHLVLNGDVFDSSLRRLTRAHWRILSLIRTLADRIEVTWLLGNHDGVASIISNLLGATIKDEIIIESGNRRILILHGHKFDTILDNHPILIWIADAIYGFMQWVDLSHRLARWAKHSSKTFLRCAQIIKSGAINYAKQHGCNTVCCGHTHAPDADISGPVTYYNSGCWTELPCGYLTVKDGDIQLYQVAQ